MIKQKVISLLSATGFFLLTPLPVWAATLSLSPSTGTFNTNCPFSLDMVLDTQGAQTDGTDAILFYDTSRLTASSITSGTIYPDYPGNNIDDSTGKITVSGLASVSQAFSGKGTLATVNFLVKQNAPTGATQIKFDFDPNDKTKTTDSNVVERGTVVDVLSSVVNGNYTIGTGACGSQTVTGGPTVVTVPQGAVSTPSGAVKEPVSALPPAGSETFTYTIAILGTALTILGILGLALL